jgi:hypothetical protein
LAETLDFSGKSRAAGELRVDLPAAAPAALDHDGGEKWLLHRPHTFDQLRDRDAVRCLDPEEHQALCGGISQLGLVVQIQLLESFQYVVEAAQNLPPLLIFPLEHRHSLLAGAGAGFEGKAHLCRAFELEPVAGALEHLEPVFALDVLPRRLRRGAAESRILIPPQE